MRVTVCQTATEAGVSKALGASKRHSGRANGEAVKYLEFPVSGDQRKNATQNGSSNSPTIETPQHTWKQNNDLSFNGHATVPATQA